MKRQLSLASNSSSQSSLGSEYAAALEREAMKACDNEDSSEGTRHFGNEVDCCYALYISYISLTTNLDFGVLIAHNEL